MDEAQVTVLHESESWPGILARLKEKGYTTALCFPRQLQGRVCMAIALGIMKHFQIYYPKIDNFLTKSWKSNKVKELVKFYMQIEGYRLEDYYEDMRFWNALGDCMREKTMREMPEKSEQLSRRRDIDIENPHMMTKVAELFMVNIFILQRADAGYLQKPLFRPSSNSIGLVILLLQEYDSLYLLLHRDLSNQQGAPGLPFYLLKEQWPTAPQILEESVMLDPVVLQPQKIDEEIVTNHVSELTTTLLQFVAQSHNASPEARASLFQALVLPAVDRFETFASFARRTFPFGNDLAAVKALTNSPELTGEHYLSECSNYNQLLKYATLPCGHAVHEDCLGSFIDYMVRKDGEMRAMELNCARCDCRIPEALVKEIRPSLYNSIQQVKIEHLHSETEQGQPHRFTPPSPRFVQSIDLAPSFYCQRCLFLKSGIYLYPSSECSKDCKICLHCVKKISHCPTCGRCYKSLEQQAIEMALENHSQSINP